MRNPLGCSVVKVSHHGSMHSIPLDVYERMSPELAVITTKQKVSSKTVGERTLTRSIFPHLTAVLALEEADSRVVTTDGSYEAEVDKDNVPHDAALAHEGSVIVVVPPGGQPRWKKLDDKAADNPDPPTKV